MTVSAALGTALVTMLGTPAPGGNSPEEPARAASAAREAERTVELDHVELVALDPGHGGSNTGCLGADGTWEKEVVLTIARRVARRLRERTDASAVLTRRRDRAVGLRERTRKANHWGADLFLSLHLNADPFGTGRGVETWFLAADEADRQAPRLVEEGQAEPPPGLRGRPRKRPAARLAAEASVRAAQAASRTLAGLVVRELHATTDAPNRGIRQARFGVLKEATMPAAVVECGFFSHHREGLRLLDEAYQERIARGIVEGIVAYDRRLERADVPSPRRTASSR